MHEESCNLNHTSMAIHDHKASGAYHGADGLEIVEIKREIQMFFCKTCTARTSDLYSLEFTFPSHASANVEDDLSQGSSHRNFNQSCICNVSSKGEGLGSRAVGCSDGKIPICTLSNDLGYCGKGLYVIEDRRRIEEAMLSRAWRLYSREASLSFDAGCKCRAFSADEGACSLCNVDSKRFTLTENIISENSHSFSFRYCPLKSRY